MHFPIDIDGEIGDRLGEVYRVGSTFPVFILTDSDAEVISRWTGFTGAGRFIQALHQAMAIDITVSDRKSRFEREPSPADALFLAKYCTDTKEYLDAIDYYRKAEKLAAGRREYSFEIFKNTANAIWKDMAQFDVILPAADDVLNAGMRNRSNIISMAVILSKLARKKEQTDKIGRYLNAGIDAASKSRSQRDAENLIILRADYALYAEKDTLRAIEIRKEGLDPQWKRKPDEFYNFAKWCAERKINLQEADFYTSKAVKLAQEGEFRAQVLSTLASIRYAQGFTDEAIVLIEKAIEQDPEKENYFDQLREFKNYQGD